MNPSNEEFYTEVITFKEDESDIELRNQWRFFLGQTMTLGLEAAYWKWKWDVVEGLNYKGSNLGGNWESDFISLKAGVSQRFLGKLLLAVQLQGRQGENKSTIDGSHEAITARYLAGNVGFELFLSEDVTVRGGYQNSNYDKDIDGPTSLTKSHNVSAGLSWLPRGGLLQLSGAVTYGNTRPWDDEATLLRDKNETSYLFGFRMLL